MVTAAQREARLQRRTAALAARAEMSPRGPSAGRFRLATWNVNSLRARAAALERFVVRTAPDVLCLQETKASMLCDEAEASLERLGYATAYVGRGAYNGVAISSRWPIRDVAASGDLGDEHLDREPRVVSCVVDADVPVRVVSLYVPHGRTVGHWHYDYKLAFLDAVAARVSEWVAQGHVIVAGDVNVAATDSDIFHPDAFVGLTHVTPPERAAWARVLDAGLVDVDAAHWGPRERRFTWWNHGIGYSRNLGMRLDVIAADREIAATVETTWIDHEERARERPSDHAALIADFDLAAIAAPTRRAHTREPKAANQATESRRFG
jgi:exodeoxyribonuclease-3